jgi:hypothetical protein
LRGTLPSSVSVRTIFRVTKQSHNNIVRTKHEDWDCFTPSHNPTRPLAMTGTKNKKRVIARKNIASHHHTIQPVRSQKRVIARNAAFTPSSTRPLAIGYCEQSVRTIFRVTKQSHNNIVRTKHEDWDCFTPSHNPTRPLAMTGTKNKKRVIARNAALISIG